MTVVVAFDPQHIEVRRESLDFAQEVLSGEALLAEFLRQRVGCRCESHTGLDQSPKQRRHEHGVTRIVEFELIDAHQSMPAEGFHGCCKSERADEVGVLHEGAVRLRLRSGVPQRRKQVGLANPEAPVEVGTGASLRRRGPPQPAPAGRRSGQTLGERLERGPRRRLRRLRWIGDVRRESLPREVRRWDEVGEDALRGHLRIAVRKSPGHGWMLRGPARQGRLRRPAGPARQGRLCRPAGPQWQHRGVQRSDL